jgi:hypothetical protein
VQGQTYTPTVMIDDFSVNFMYELGLPAPVDSRGQVIPAFFTNGGSPTPTPTPDITPTPSPTQPPTATPTQPPTPTPTGTLPPGSSLISNGGFESSGNWVYGGTSHPTRSSAQAHSGKYSLKVGLNSKQQGDAIAYQMVSIPASAHSATLSFYYWPASNDSSTYGWQEADVTDSNGNILQQLFVNTTDDQTWIQMTFDLSAYIGQTIGIQFLDHEASNGGSYFTYMYVDDVALTVR